LTSNVCCAICAPPDETVIWTAWIVLSRIWTDVPNSLCSSPDVQASC